VKQKRGKTFVISVALSMLCSVWTSIVLAQGIASELIKYPDTIYINAEIITLDNHNLNSDPGTIVEAMAIRDSVIIALGSIQHVMRYAGPETEVIDLGGKMVLPGIVESHVHPMTNTERLAREKFGLRSTPTGYDLRMDVAATADETMVKVARAMELLLANVNPGPDDWISISLESSPDLGYTSADVGNLMNARRLADVRISKEYLTEIIPDYPFILTSGIPIFGKTGVIPDSIEMKEKGVWYHITVDEHGDPVWNKVIEFNE